MRRCGWAITKICSLKQCQNGLAHIQLRSMLRGNITMKKAEVNVAIRNTKCGKSAESGGISGELLKVGGPN